MEIEPPLVTGVPIVEYLLAPLRTSVGRNVPLQWTSRLGLCLEGRPEGSSSSSAATYVTALKVEAGG